MFLCKSYLVFFLMCGNTSGCSTFIIAKGSDPGFKFLPVVARKKRTKIKGKRSDLPAFYDYPTNIASVEFSDGLRTQFGRGLFENIGT